AVREEIGEVRRNVELEARLIDDLLDPTRIARGNLRLNLETHDLHAVVRRAVDICCHGGEGNAVHMEVRLEAQRHHVKADPARMQQVFWNLLANARKFTAGGGRIAVRSRNTDNGDGSVIVEVSDTGVGID